MANDNGTAKTTFPFTQADKKRLTRYIYFEKLFRGQHFDAFKAYTEDSQFNAQYQSLNYVMVNFAGMISKIVADFLFGEKLTFKFENTEAQKWGEEFWKVNRLDLLLYESALSNSFAGDAVFKLRTGKRLPNDKEVSPILDALPPNIYFPKIDQFNIMAEPEKKELAWEIKIGDNNYLRREIHSIGKIENELWLMKGDELQEKVSLSLLDPKLKEVETFNVDKHLIVHVPNWRIISSWEGISDYYDIDNLFFSINKRMTMVDNVLDKHTDPILMVPPGVLGEDGRPRKKDHRVIEMGDGEDGKPEYVVWDASLENAFKHIEKLVEFLYMVGEVSPDVLGLGKGTSDSGRALKFKLMRTLAKVNRKKRYYDYAIKELIYTAQVLSKNTGASVNGKKVTWEPEIPELNWQDGLPVDEVEQIDIESKSIDAGVTSKLDAMIRIYGYDEKTAEAKMREIDKETQIELPTTNMAGSLPPKPNQPIKKQ